MKIFFDTNIILEYLLDREASEDVNQIMFWVDEHKCDLYLSAGSVYTMAYSIDNHWRKTTNYTKEQRLSMLREILSTLFNRFITSNINSENFLKAVENELFTDLEDSFQWQNTIVSGCDVILTLNIKDFKNVRDSNNPKVMVPQEFIEKYL